MYRVLLRRPGVSLRYVFGELLTYKSIQLRAGVIVVGVILRLNTECRDRGGHLVLEGRNIRLRQRGVSRAGLGNGLTLAAVRGLHRDLYDRLGIRRNDKRPGRQVQLLRGSVCIHRTAHHQRVGQRAQIGARHVDRRVRRGQLCPDLVHFRPQTGDLIRILGIAGRCDQNGQRFRFLGVRQHLIQITAERVDLVHNGCAVLIIIGKAAVIRVVIVCDQVVKLQLAVCIHAAVDHVADNALEVRLQACIRRIILVEIRDIDHAVQGAQLCAVKLAHVAVNITRAQTVQRILLVRSLFRQRLGQVHRSEDLCVCNIAQRKTIEYLDLIISRLVNHGFVSTVKVMNRFICTVYHSIGIRFPDIARIVRGIIRRAERVAAQRHKRAVRVRVTRVDDHIAVQRAGGQDRLFFFRQRRACALSRYGVKITGCVCLADLAAHIGIAGDCIYAALRVVHAVHRIVVHLLGRGVLLQRHAVAVRNAFGGLAVKARAIGDRVSFRRIGDGIVGIRRQGAAQLCRAAVKMCGVIDLRPLCQRGCFQPGRRDGCQHILAAHAVGQRDLAGLRAENRQVRGIRSRARHLQLHGHVHVPHTHIVLHRSRFNGQRLRELQRVHIGQRLGQRRDQTVQRLILVVRHAGLYQRRALACSRPVGGENGVGGRDPLLHLALQGFRLIQLHLCSIRNPALSGVCIYVIPELRVVQNGLQVITRSFCFSLHIASGSQQVLSLGSYGIGVQQRIQIQLFRSVDIGLGLERLCRRLGIVGSKGTGHGRSSSQFGNDQTVCQLGQSVRCPADHAELRTRFGIGQHIQILHALL